MGISARLLGRRHGFNLFELLGASIGGALALASASALAAPSAIPIGGDPAAPTVFKPAETADAVLHAENVSWNRHLHDALRLPDWLDFAVDHRTRFEFLDDPVRPGESQTQTQIPQRTRVRLGVDAPGGVRVLAEFQDSRVWNDRPRDFLGGAINHFDVTQLLIAASAKDVLDRGLRVDGHVGRLSLDLGSRRLVARNEFRNTTNAFDGVHVQLGSDARTWRVRAFYTLPVELQDGDVLDDKVSSRQRFWGFAFEDLRNPWLRLDAYALVLDDLPGDRSYRTYGLRVYRVAAVSQVDYEGELMAQFGERGERDQSAFAAHGELGFTFGVPWSPRVAVQIDYASGTGDPSDDDSHTFDPLFGARRFDLGPTGILGALPRTNIITPGVRLGLMPMKTLRLDLKIRYWSLAEARDAFARSGLVDPTGDAGRDLGTDIDLRARWDATTWLAFDAGYVHWFKGRYLDDVGTAQTTGDLDYFYAQTRVRF